VPFRYDDARDVMVDDATGISVRPGGGRTDYDEHPFALRAPGCPSGDRYTDEFVFYVQMIRKTVQVARADGIVRPYGFHAGCEISKADLGNAFKVYTKGDPARVANVRAMVEDAVRVYHARWGRTPDAVAPYFTKPEFFVRFV